jgi:hypothetical protein
LGGHGNRGTGSIPSGSGFAGAPSALRPRDRRRGERPHVPRMIGRASGIASSVGVDSAVPVRRFHGDDRRWREWWLPHWSGCGGLTGRVAGWSQGPASRRTAAWVDAEARLIPSTQATSVVVCSSAPPARGSQGRFRERAPTPESGSPIPGGGPRRPRRVVGTSSAAAGSPGR